jgi:hypothetical protein
MNGRLFLGSFPSHIFRQGNAAVMKDIDIVHRTPSAKRCHGRVPRFHQIQNVEMTTLCSNVPPLATSTFAASVPLAPLSRNDSTFFNPSNNNLSLKLRLLRSNDFDK